MIRNKNFRTIDVRNWGKSDDYGYRSDFGHGYYNNTMFTAYENPDSWFIGHNRATIPYRVKKTTFKRLFLLDYSRK